MTDPSVDPSELLLAALSLALVIVGLLPFFSPGLLRRIALRAAQFGDGQIRFAGLSCMLIGLALLLLMWN